MKRLTEKKSLDFLEKEGFEVVWRESFSTRFGLKKSLEKFGGDSTMEAIGKNSLVLEGGIEIPKNYTLALFEFKRLKKLKGFKEILIKEKIKGKRFFVRIERERKSGSLSFSFLDFEKHGPRVLVSRAFPINKLKLKEMIKTSKLPEIISKKVKDNFEGFVLKLYNLFKKEEQIRKIEINSLFVNEKGSVVVNSRVFLD